jgi:hypothetical protein
LKSRMLWSQVFSILVMFLVTKGLQQGNFALGLDWAGVLIDMLVGTIFGFAVSLTLHRDMKKIVGFALCALLTFLVFGLLGVVAIDSFVFSDKAGFQGKKGGHDVAKDASQPQGPEPHRLPEEAATPRPTLPDEEQDPPEIAKMRKKATNLLEAYGPLPWPSGDPADQRAARKVREDLVKFEEHWTKTTSANLEVEQAELALLASDLGKAEFLAEAGLTELDAKSLSPTKVQGTVRAKRIARLHGVLGICYMKKGGEEIAAEAQFKEAADWDPTLLEVRFYLGKLAPPHSPEQKKQLQLYIDGAGSKMPEWRKDRVVEAKQLLGVE